jgi:predicted Zn-dependent protease
VYFIRVLDDDLKNAISLPGGYVYIFRGLWEKLKTDDELAGVIAHELGHITAKHGIKRLQAAYGAMAVQLAAVHVDDQLATGVSYLISTLFTEYSQENEFEADRLAVKYLKKSRFDPKGMAGALEVLHKEQERAPVRELNYWKTHPGLPQRKAVVNQEITGSLEFTDYIQLIGE